MSTFVQLAAVEARLGQTFPAGVVRTKAQADLDDAEALVLLYAPWLGPSPALDPFPPIATAVIARVALELNQAPAAGVTSETVGPFSRAYTARTADDTWTLTPAALAALRLAQGGAVLGTVYTVSLAD